MKEIQARLCGVCLGAAVALVSEGVASTEDTDRGAKIGLRWGLGPFEIMNRLGIEESYRLVQKMTERYQDFKIPEILSTQRELGVSFLFKYIDLDIKEQLAFITINRPEALNALNETILSQLEQKFTEAENNPEVIAIVIRGAG